MLKTTDMGAKNFQQGLHGESGSALLASFLLVVMLTGAGMAAMTSSSVGLNKSKNVASQKQAYYIAEAAMNHGKMFLHQNIANWNAYATASAQTLIPSTSFAGIGSYTVKIKAASGGGLLMTATGTANNNATTSVSTLYSLDNGNTLGNAFLAGKNLTVSGNPTLAGTSGGIHANGNLTISGSPTIATHADASGTYTVTATGHPTVAGFTGGGQPQETINPITASTYYGTQDYYFYWNYNYSDNTYHSIVYDKNWNVIADTAPGGTVNIGGNTCWQYTSYSYSYSWTLHAYVWTPFTWTATCQPPNGTYYVNGEAVISGNIGTAANPWIATILSAGSIEVTSPSLVIRPPVSGDGSLYKSQTMNLLFVASKDVLITGNANQNFRGITSSYEQTSISGNPVYYGYFMSQSVTSTATTYMGTNSVTNTSITGNMALTYNGDLQTSTQGYAVPQARLY
ncbi:MAG: hypothetical protein EPO02_03020 [Nitrospirae bacterium]|nr:MAG: hypothetical protein EPO02_03020 [Nitrospirota bacterium]